MPSGTQIAARSFENQSDRAWAMAWMEWVPIVASSAIVCIFRGWLAAWQFMWLMSIAIFEGFKWETWIHAKAARRQASLMRNIGYMLLWPGMDADTFLAGGSCTPQPRLGRWAAASAKALAGLALVLATAEKSRELPPLIAGWMGMVGLALFLHFGAFELMALIWRSAGVRAEPLMKSPLAADSLAEFWGRRWNTGFRRLSHDLVFQRLYKRVGIVPATMAAFLASGLIHEVVISLPARGGYGLPTAYFLLQAIGVLAERSAVGKRLDLSSGVGGRVFVLLFAGVPAFILFHPPFVLRVGVPFLRAIASVRRWH